MVRYSPSEIEKKWQDYWYNNNVFESVADSSKKKFYCLDMFPYPSGAGLHVGHPEGYTATDIICRYKRAKGFNVLHPMGWDAFGLPAEQYAIQTGTHPAITTDKNCSQFRNQIKRLGLGYDWKREINTTDKGYYKWTQWIFIQLYNTWYDNKINKGRPISELLIPDEIRQQGMAAICTFIDSKRLAYYADASVWWCRNCQTVCANEEVLADGSHEKCGTVDVERRNLKQWLLRIPHYAERLLSGLDELDWPAGIKDMQRNWIGRSTGAEVDFSIAGGNGFLRVFTTRPDTLFGATYMVVSPEHPILREITLPEYLTVVNEYCRTSSLKSDMDRTELAKDKTGVFTGSYAVNPVNGEKIPIWVSDYVLMSYGTGAIMAVPAHDKRDFDFAVKFSLPIRCIMEPDSTCPASTREAILSGQYFWENDGKYINCGNDSNNGIKLAINGLDKQSGIETVLKWLEEKGIGKRTVNYKIRDWLFSRQRYWGEPFPIIHWEDGTVSTVDEADLPVELPQLTNFKPSSNGESPLCCATDWISVTDKKTGKKGKREINTMPQWAGSCWYYLRYISPDNAERFVDTTCEKYWMPVDLYVGGAEHAVLHLLYSRFWHKVLYDLGLVSTDEPFKKLFNQGMILAFAYEDSVGSKVPSDEVEERAGKFYKKGTNIELRQIVAKMSKSLKNVVNPDDVVDKYGADTLRLYEMFMGPLEATKPWQTQGLEGQYRFLNRVWRAVIGDDQQTPLYTNEKPPADIMRLAHQSILKVSNDIENMRFNTAISQLMIFCNEILRGPVRYREINELLVKLLHPFAPHIAEEMWMLLGHENTLTVEPWPEGSALLAAEDGSEIIVQVNGKLKCKIKVSKGLSAKELEEVVRSNSSVTAILDGSDIVRVVSVPDRLVNFVIRTS